MPSSKTSTHTHTLPALDLPLIRKIYDLYKTLYNYIKQFQKYDRNILGREIEQTTLDLLKITIFAAHLPPLRKIVPIEHAIVLAEELKILIRLAYELKVLDLKKYIRLEEFLHEIGKMLGGWKKSLL